MSPMAEVGSLIAGAVGVTTIAGKIHEWAARRGDESFQRRFLNFTRKGEYGNEHLNSLFREFVREDRKR